MTGTRGGVVVSGRSKDEKRWRKKKKGKAKFALISGNAGVSEKGMRASYPFFSEKEPKFGDRSRMTRTGGRSTLIKSKEETTRSKG